MSLSRCSHDPFGPGTPGGTQPWGSANYAGPARRSMDPAGGTPRRGQGWSKKLPEEKPAQDWRTGPDLETPRLPGDNGWQIGTSRMRSSSYSVRLGETYLRTRLRCRVSPGGGGDLYVYSVICLAEKG